MLLFKYLNCAFKRRKKGGERMKRYLTQENAAQYVGKYLECYPARFHYYPLKVWEHGGKFYVTDRNGVGYLVPFKGEKGDSPIPFTRVLIPSTSLVPDDLPSQKRKVVKT